MSLLVPISRTPSRNASPNSLASSPARDWVFRVCDFSLKPAKTCVFKEILFFGFLTFLCSLRRPLYLREEILNLQKLGFQEIANPAETLGFLASSPTYLFRLSHQRSPPSLLHQTR
ncbi:unnamed protein product [Malus baccata var. baccata]